MKLIGRFAAVLGLAASPAVAGVGTNWPDLPKTGFIAGRVATVEDTKRGDAAFSMDGQGRGVLPVKVPQYAWWTDEAGVKHPMILIQAEIAPDGSKIVGLRSFAGQETVATLSEVELLGTKKPN
ncbi:hypothetical protein [Sphingomonas sp. Leaf33]|uniref:hypothetical protein n=1 Tax=Sphingomonas sp. Leaf33 TaxID=1736215 RepID=UPI0009EB961E|nr:hypothetical protein [Sphingomonas sp. Leaf33]